MKFAHLGDCHLGGWRQPELRELNFNSFQFATSYCIKERMDFVIITGDLFDTAYPSIETLKRSFEEFRRLREANIPVFLIAGSHDYSVSGKTFLDVLEKAGFCKNVARFSIRNETILLEPTIYKNVAIFGYPGKKSSLEIEDLEKIKLQDAPGMFKILMLHTAIRDAIGDLPIKAVNEKYLPKTDYLALSHLHINYQRNGRVYSGPTFPNNLSELEELQSGSFYSFENGRIRRIEIKLKEVLPFVFEISDAFTATEKIISEISNKKLEDKIVIVRLIGTLERGKTTDIDFQKIESFVKERGAYVFLKSTSRLHMPEPEVKLEFIDSENLESQIIKKFEEAHPHKMNSIIPELMRTLIAEKLEDENSSTFEERLMSESRRILQI